MCLKFAVVLGKMPYWLVPPSTISKKKKPKMKPRSKVDARTRQVVETSFSPIIIKQMAQWHVQYNKLHWDSAWARAGSRVSFKKTLPFSSSDVAGRAHYCRCAMEPEPTLKPNSQGFPPPHSNLKDKTWVAWLPQKWGHEVEYMKHMSCLLKACLVYINLWHALWKEQFIWCKELSLVSFTVINKCFPYWLPW